MNKRKILFLFTSLMCFSGSMVTYAQTNTNALKNIQSKIQQNTQEKQSVNQEIQKMQQEISSLNTYNSEIQKALEETQQKMTVTNQHIEQKREDIVALEDKILMRKYVMKERLIALQLDNNLSLLIKVFLDAKGFDDFVQRASAVTALFTADNEILSSQQNDLRQLEADKEAVNKQELILEKEQQSLAEQQGKLDVNLQKRQAALTDLQTKFSQIDKQMSFEQKEKTTILTQIQTAQAKIKQEQAAAKAREAASKAQSAVKQAPAVNSTSTSNNTSNSNNNSTGNSSSDNGKEIYVTATAYSPEDSGAVTATGYNIKNNPNMKLIAVDPDVIPLGSKVWVEGYGNAVAGDTGGAIKGYKIDVLMPTKDAALAWGRKTVKVILLH